MDCDALASAGKKRKAVNEKMCKERIGLHPMPDNVNHPFHYQGKYECIDEMVALFGVDAVRHFCMCNVYKYRFRASRKNGPEDIEKAEWYMGCLSTKISRNQGQEILVADDSDASGKL